MKQSILARLRNIETAYKSDPTIILVDTGDGEIKEVTVDEYEKHATKWYMTEMVYGSATKSGLRDVDRILRCMEKWAESNYS